jgi:hypothetical protein
MPCKPQANPVPVVKPEGNSPGYPSEQERSTGIKREEMTTSWEMMSEGGNPFRNPNPVDEKPQENDSKNEETFNYNVFSKCERILNEALEMITCCPQSSLHLSGRKSGVLEVKTKLVESHSGDVDYDVTGLPTMNLQGLNFGKDHERRIRRILI